MAMLHPARSEAYSHGTGGHMSHRVLLTNGNESLSRVMSSQGSAPAIAFDESYFAAVATRAAATIRGHHAHIEPNFLSGALLADARKAAASLAAAGGSSDPLPSALVCVMAAVERLRAAAAAATGRPLLESAELQIVTYKPGGSYQTHVDDKPGIRIGASGRTDVRRALSLLIYLTPDDWYPAADGGALRVHSQPAQDVQPTAGTLVLFDSATLPHEVLTTRRERMLLAGWLHEPRGPR